MVSIPPGPPDEVAQAPGPPDGVAQAPGPPDGAARATAAQATARPPGLSPVAARLAERKLPPIAAVAVVIMALALAGGIDVAAYLPRRPSLALPIGFLAAAGVLLVGNVAQLSRLSDFAWQVFWRVAGWACLAYVVIAGMIEYVLVYDGTRGSMLAVMSTLIVVFAADIPLLLGFSVARYQEPRPAG